MHNRPIIGANSHHRLSARGRPDMGEVSRQLALQPIAVLAAIFPGAKPSRNELRLGSVAGEPGGSLRIAVGGADSMRWIDHATGERGDALELAAKALFGGNRLQAMAWALALLRLDDSTPPPRRPDPAPLRQVHSEPESPGHELWRRILIESTAAAATLAEVYLASRGLRLPDDDYDGVLRFHGLCPCRGGRYPAMIAAMMDPVTNQPVGIHRTFLAADGRGKAQIDTPKMMMGRAGTIRLTPDESVTHGLGICEGVETGLAILQRAQWAPIWAATSAGGIAGFPVLAGIESITIFADHDAVNRFGKQPGIDAARQCAARWHAAGREVHIKKPPVGLDWHDALKVAA